MSWLNELLKFRKKGADKNSVDGAAILYFDVKRADGEPEIISMAIENGSLNVLAKHPNVAFMIGALAKAFLDSGAENYLEVQMSSPAHPDGFTITIQKRGKKTPHQLRREAEFRCVELQSEIDRLNEAIAQKSTK